MAGRETSEAAKALTQETESIRHQRRLQLKRDERRNTGGNSRARAEPREPTEARDSLLHRPPVSTEMTTNLARRPRVPRTSSFFVHASSGQDCSICRRCIEVGVTTNPESAPQRDVHSHLGSMAQWESEARTSMKPLVVGRDVDVRVSERGVEMDCRTCLPAHTGLEWEKKNVYLLPRLLSSWRKTASISPCPLFLPAFHWWQFPCFLSTLTDFPLLLLFASAPGTVFRFWPQHCEFSLFDPEISSPWISISGSSVADSSDLFLVRYKANTVLRR